MPIFQASDVLPMILKRQSANSPSDETSQAERKAVALLLEGVATSQLVIDLAGYRSFRASILRSPLNLPELLPEQELVGEVKSVVREFERYRTASDATLKARRTEWRQAISQLAQMLATYHRIDQTSDMWTGMSMQLTSATTAEEIAALRQKLVQLFQSVQSESTARRIREIEKQDMSTANHNAAGLRGGGAAIEHVDQLIADGKPGCIGLFRLNCLDVVGERFGQEGIQDCLMSVAAFLTQNLSGEDSIYHWSESSLVAICERRIRADILTAEWNRVLARNRDFTICIGGRNIMLRIPIHLEVFPLSQVSTADDLKQLLAERGAGPRCNSYSNPLPVGGRAGLDASVAVKS